VPSLFETLKNWNHHPRKRIGQHFLVNTSILSRIESSIPWTEVTGMVEVGGGTGILSERLAARHLPLWIIEMDDHLFGALKGQFGNQAHVHLIHQDVLKANLHDLKPPSIDQWTIIGNIPYYLTTPLIFRILTLFFKDCNNIFFMVQKEVADRMMAKVGTKAYGALTLGVQYFSVPKILFSVPASCFFPPPKVESAFVQLKLKSDLPLTSRQEKIFFSIIRAIFQSRRKIITNSLKKISSSSENIKKALDQMDIHFTSRGEQLSLEQLIRLSVIFDQKNF
jgi:16S rRNA (adenine1518-N6/adenine1519-N6)-dimethyltransferase